MVLTQLVRRDPFNSVFIMLFPYHYGSYATYELSCARSESGSVSIPLWFLRNACLLCPTRRRQGVSIPLWFLRNYYNMQQIAKMTGMFPYHYGSYATHEGVKELNNKTSFHTTMVLTQPVLRHTGSRKEVRVSIPLWFLRNRSAFTTSTVKT